MNDSEKFIEFLRGYLFDKEELNKSGVKLIKDKLSYIDNPPKESKSNKSWRDIEYNRIKNKTLKILDKSVRNFKKGKVGKVIKLPKI